MDMIRALLVALLLAGCNIPTAVEAPEAGGTNPADVVGRYASHTEVICYPCASYSLDLELYRDGTCGFGQAIEATDGVGWSLYRSDTCIYRVDGDIVIANTEGLVRHEGKPEGYYTSLTVRARAADIVWSGVLINVRADASVLLERTY